MQNGSIEVGDVVVLEEGRRGRVILASKGGKYLLLRLSHSQLAGAEPAYLLCSAREARRINSWWNWRRKRGALHRRGGRDERSAA